MTLPTRLSSPILSKKDTPPFVSVIVPCRNEIKHINSCIESISSQDYPAEKLEILMVDGMSDDGTRDVIARFASTNPAIQLIDNPQRITPAAFNRGIKKSRGAYILLMGAHNQYPSDYISRCVKALEQLDADNVGGGIVPVPRSTTFFSASILCVISHPFGVGNSKFRTHSNGPIEADTVFGGCYRREVFELIGLFNERLVHSQDMEFNLRLKKAGGKIFLIPSICSRYYARSDLFHFCRHNWTNGKWAILPFKYSDIVPVSIRHLVPLFFVAFLLSATLLMFFSLQWGVVALAGIVIPYCFLSAYFSYKEASARKSLRMLCVLPLTFFLLHFFYGLGSIVGFLQSVGSINFWRQFLRVRFINS